MKLKKLNLKPKTPIRFTAFRIIVIDGKSYMGGFDLSSTKDIGGKY